MHEDTVRTHAVRQSDHHVERAAFFYKSILALHRRSSLNICILLGSQVRFEPRSTMSLLNDISAPLPEEEIAEGYKRIVLMPALQQMMFVAGETGEPSSETTTLIEQIVHEQVIEMVSLSISVCLRS